MKIISFYIFLTTILIGCQSGNQKQKTGDLPIINLSNNYSKKEIRLKDISDIEYIPLETKDHVLLGYAHLKYVSDNYMVIFDVQGNVYIFNRNGAFISHISHKGNGPREYTNLSGILFDEKNEEIFLTDGSTNRSLVYSIFGDYKRTIKYTTDIYLPSIYNFDDETMLVYNNDIKRSNNKYSKKPYMLLSKKDGSFVANIDITLHTRYANVQALEIGMSNGQKAYTSVSINTYNNMYYGDDFVIADMSSDTIYKLTLKRELIPMLARTPSVHSSKSPIVWSTILTTDKYIILYKTILDFVAKEQGANVPEELLMYEYETGHTYNVSLVNDDLEGRIRVSLHLTIDGVDILKNMLAQLVWPNQLKKYYETKQLKGELVKIPDEEDNPIVAIYHFK